MRAMLAVSSATAFFQDGNYIDEKVGNVAVNPAWVERWCLVADYCANADVALVAIDPGITGVKAVAESSAVGTGNNAGNLTVGNTYNIHAYNDVAVGYEVYRTGQTTGSTRGLVEATCVGIQYQESSGKLLHVSCAHRVDARADPGDSGGPVYYWTVPLVTTARMAAGKVFAVNLTGDRKYWYSPLSEAQSRLGNFGVGF